MKLFISYAREDTDFAKYVHKYFRDKQQDVFTDIHNIRVGDAWADSIERNISECDIFIVIVTLDSITSPNVEKEVLLAQKQNKIIVPCISEDVDYSEIRWGLEKVQAVEFSDEYKLARKLFSKIKNYTNLTKETQNNISQETIKKTTINQIYNFSNIRELYDTCLSLYSKRMYNEGVSSFDKYLEIEPNYVEFWNKRGLSLLYLKKYDEAIESFNNALNINSYFIEAKKNKLITYKLKQLTDILTEKSENNGNYTAIIVGINNYPPDPRIPQLHGAENDAIEVLDRFMKNIEFKIFPYQFLLGPDATRKSILKAIKECARNTNYELIIFYFSGYGIITEETSYIAPYDMEPTDIDTSCIKLEDLKSMYYEYKGEKSIFFIFDCAYLNI